MFGAGIFVTSILTLLTPLAAKAGVPALIAVRLIEGIFEVRSILSSLFTFLIIPEFFW